LEHFGRPDHNVQPKEKHIMAGTKHRPGAAGVTVEPYGWGDELSGERAALEAHPRCPPGIFDGEGLTWKVSRKIKMSDGSTTSVTKVGRRYRVRVALAPIEREARLVARNRLIDVSETLKRCELLLQRFPDSSSRYREAVLYAFGMMFEPQVQHLADGTFGTVRGGYMLDADARNLVGIHVQAIRGALETGRIVFDAAKREADVAEIMAPARAADPGFGRMLGGLTGGSPLPLNE
jgi:hypothetical protein